MIKFFPSIRVFVEIGSFQIMWYAVLIVAGIYLAYLVSLRNLKKVGYSSDEVDGLLMGALIFGFLGARIWYVLFSGNLSEYMADPLSILMIREGGLAIQGGLLAGGGFAVYYTRRHNFNFWQWADLIVPNILIAQAIGRWGNFLNQEAYGGAVSESFYNHFPAWFKEIMYIQGSYRVPTFLYESIANILGWVLIVLVLKRFSRIRRGDLTFAYLMWYGATRFFIEGLRTDSLMFMDFRVAQIISLIFVFVGVAGYLGLFRKFKKSPKPVILFDFDGTLMDTQAAIIASYKEVFTRRRPDLMISDEEYLSFLGPTLYETMGNYLAEEEIEEAVEEYRKHNRDLHKTLVKPMENAEVLIHDLKEKGYQLGIVSSKLKEVVELGLSPYSFKDAFDVIVGYGDVEKAKPDPAGIFYALSLMGRQRDQVIYVGDSVTDVEAGQRAGSFTIGYVFDKIREEELKASEPNRLIDDLLEIQTILEEDHEWTVTMM